MTADRLLEPLGALSLVTDLARGRGRDHALRCSLVAATVAERAELAPPDAAAAFYASLLRSIGCTASSHEYAVALGGDDIAVRREGDLVDPSVPREAMRLVLRLAAAQPAHRRPGVIAAGLRHGAATAEQAAHADCEVASHLALRLGFDTPVADALYQSFERWDGKGAPTGLAGEQISLAARVATLAAAVVMLVDALGREVAADTLGRWRGRILDPGLTDLALRELGAVAAPVTEREPLAAALEREPPPARPLDDAALDALAEAFANIADLKSTYLHGHSSGVAALAARAASLAGLDVTALRRAALLHDIGRVTVATGVWDRRGGLSSGEWELVRLHAYHGERVLSRGGVLAPLARPVGAHHERADGSGYHRGVRAGELDLECGLLAAADVYHALGEDRPHRPAMTADGAARMLAESAIHPDAVAAVLEAAGQRPPPRAWPAGLTDREVDVVRLAARGLLMKQIAATLEISPSTVHTHLAHAYEKIGVSTRAAAAVFAMESGLL